VNIWNPDNYKSLTPAQRSAVEARTPKGKTAVEYLNDLGAGLAAVDSYVEADRQADRTAHLPFFEHMLALPDDVRASEAVRIRDLCEKAGQDVSDLNEIIAGFAAQAEAAVRLSKER
jgi:hypothetical protein